MRLTVILTLMFSLRVPGTINFVFAQESKQVARLDDDHRAVQALVSKLVAASNANDVKAFAEVFAADADFTNVFGQQANGRSTSEARSSDLCRQ